MNKIDWLGVILIGIGVFGYLNPGMIGSGAPETPPTEIFSIVMDSAPKGSGDDLEVISNVLVALSNSIAVDGQRRKLYDVQKMQQVLLHANEASFPAGFDFEEKYPALASAVGNWAEEELETADSRAKIVAKLRELADAYRKVALVK